MIAKSRKYELIKYITSLIDCVSEMNKYLDFIIDNAGSYYYDLWRGIIRNKSSGGIVYASNDIDNINKAAIKFMEIIDK